ncbi:dihydropteroate synthase [Alicyclobacillus ferrooxydans]|nr:dihydropteroate synthase [Alicyclobacillus ferrooxydans]
MQRVDMKLPTDRDPGWQGRDKGTHNVQKRTLVMGIVNVTPDSFSDGGSFANPAAAISHAYQLIEDGADILDIGGESTRPGHQPVPWDEEWARVLPVLKELTTNCKIPISLDTTKARVADKAIRLGVTIINDIWGGQADPDMLPLAADAKCTYVWMHNRHEPVSSEGFTNLMQETMQGIEQCLGAGIDKARLWLDPGIGFGKTHVQNLTALRRLPEYCALGYPVLLGTSRKRVVGRTLDLPVSERLEGSLATVSYGVMSGIDVVRVHDVKETVRTCRMIEAILGAEE